MLRVRGHPMANENPSDAALRAHLFDRSFLKGRAAGNRSGELTQGEVPAAPRSPDFAAEFEAALGRILNGNTAGLRPPPEKLPPDRPSGAPSAPAAAEKPKPISLTGALRQLPPATWPIDLETGKVSSSAPPPKPASTRPAAVTSARDGSPAASPERQAGTRPPAGGVLKRPDYAAEVPPTLRYHDAALLPDSVAVDEFDDDRTAESERFDGPSAADLARRYAPQMPAAASLAQAARLMPEPRAARPIRWQASDDTPPGSLLRPPSGVNWTRQAAAVAMVLAGVVGGVATVVNLELLAAPRPAGGAAADPMPAGASEDERSAAAGARSPGKTTTATRVPVKAVEVILVDDTGDGLAPAERTLLPGSAQVIPLPHPISTGVGLRPTRDAGDGGDAGEVAALRDRVVTAVPPVDAAPGGMGADAPVADPGDVSAVGADLRPTRDAGDGGDAAEVAALHGGVVGAAPPVDAVPGGMGADESVANPGDASAVGADLRPTRDAGDGGDAGEVAALHGRVVERRSTGRRRLPAVWAIDEPLADPGDVSADGADTSAAPPPRAPTPRPDYGGSPPEGVLAYAPAADPPGRRAKAVAGKGNDRPAAKASQPAAARVVSEVPWVSVRASADNRAPTVTVLLAGSLVTVVKCTSWCEIVVDGKRGFVLKSFLRATGADHRRDAGGSAFGNPYLKNSS